MGVRWRLRPLADVWFSYRICSTSAMAGVPASERSRSSLANGGSDLVDFKVDALSVRPVYHLVLAVIPHFVEEAGF